MFIHLSPPKKYKIFHTPWPTQYWAMLLNLLDLYAF